MCLNQDYRSLQLCGALETWVQMPHLTEKQFISLCLQIFYFQNTILQNTIFI